MFKGFEPVKLEEIFPQLDVDSISFEKFLSIYRETTNIPHNFLYIDRIHNKLRIGFDTEIVLD